MPFTAPKLSPNGSVIHDIDKEPLQEGGRCLTCGERDPARYVNCRSAQCNPVYYDDTSSFTIPKPLVSAFELAARMRRHALTLEWDADPGYLDKLMRRARELEKGDTAEVPDEDF